MEFIRPLTLIGPLRVRSWATAVALVVLTGSAQAALIIDNFKASVGITQVLEDKTNNSTAVLASFLNTGNAVILGGQRDVSVNLLGAGQFANSSSNVMFTNNGAQLGLGASGASAEVVFSYNNLDFDAAAAGSYISLQRVMNWMPSGSSSGFNNDQKMIEVGQTVTLSFTDA